jgi:aminopeptidase N
VFVPVPADTDEGFDLLVPTERGAENEIHIEWTDTWPFTSTAPEGRSIWPQFPLPGVVSRSWPFELKFGTYEDDKMASACSGLTVGESRENGIVWVTSTSTGHDWPRCGIGSWATYAEPPREQFPGIRVALYKEENRAASSVPGFARTVIAFYEGLLPPLATDEVEIVQVPDQLFGMVWTSTLGIVTLQQAKTYGFESSFRSNLPHLEEGIMSHEIAHQWWGALVDNAREEDRWLVESLAETYSCVFLAAAYGPETCSTREEEWQAEIEEKTSPRVSWSLTRAWSARWWTRHVYDYGPLILNRTLRRRIGDQAFFAALDGWSRDRAHTPATTGGLEAAFEHTSGQDLTAFFDQWVDDGFVPNLTGEWSAQSVTLRSDIPFGTIEAPVAVMHADGQTETRWVAVTDGVGKLAFDTPATRVILDPEQLVPASSRKLVAAK